MSTACKFNIGRGRIGKGAAAVATGAQDDSSNLRLKQAVIVEWNISEGRCGCAAALHKCATVIELSGRTSAAEVERCAALGIEEAAIVDAPVRIAGDSASSRPNRRAGKIDGAAGQTFHGIAPNDEM